MLLYTVLCLASLRTATARPPVTAPPSDLREGERLGQTSGGFSWKSCNGRGGGDGRRASPGLKERPIADRPAKDMRWLGG